MNACVKCGLPSVRRQGSSQWLCAKHYRTGQMRVTAKRRGKMVPSHADFECMPGIDLTCPDCGVAMNWLAADGQATVASLQHYRDGTMAIVCRACNTRHTYMDGDSFRDMPKDHKQCGKCRRILGPESYYWSDGRRGQGGRSTECKECLAARRRAYRCANRDKYNAYQRARYARLKSGAA